MVSDFYKKKLFPSSKPNWGVAPKYHHDCIQVHSLELLLGNVHCLKVRNCNSQSGSRQKHTQIHTDKDIDNASDTLLTLLSCCCVLLWAVIFSHKQPLPHPHVRFAPLCRLAVSQSRCFYSHRSLLLESSSLVHFPTFFLPIFLRVYLFLKPVCFLGANRAESASVRRYAGEALYKCSDAMQYSSLCIYVWMYLCRPIYVCKSVCIHVSMFISICLSACFLARQCVSIIT